MYAGVDALERPGKGFAVLGELDIGVENRQLQRQRMPAGVGEIGAQRVDEAPGRMHAATMQQNNALRGIVVGRGRLGVEGQNLTWLASSRTASPVTR